MLESSNERNEAELNQRSKQRNTKKEGKRKRFKSSQDSYQVIYEILGEIPTDGEDIGNRYGLDDGVVLFCHFHKIKLKTKSEDDVVEIINLLAERSAWLKNFLIYFTRILLAHTYSNDTIRNLCCGIEDFLHQKNPKVATLSEPLWELVALINQDLEYFCPDIKIRLPDKGEKTLGYDSGNSESRVKTVGIPSYYLRSQSVK